MLQELSNETIMLPCQSGRGTVRIARGACSAKVRNILSQTNFIIGAWRSPVARLHGVQEVPSSNLGAPTEKTPIRSLFGSRLARGALAPKSEVSPAGISQAQQTLSPRLVGSHPKNAVISSRYGGVFYAPNENQTRMVSCLGRIA